jgi:hypothetical protein
MEGKYRFQFPMFPQNPANNQTIRLFFGRIQPVNKSLKPDRPKYKNAQKNKG